MSIDPKKWLMALGSLCAGSMSADEAKAKMDAYLPLVAQEYPPEAFTADSLKSVAGQCKFFPAYGELCSYLSAWWKENRPYVPLVAAPLPTPRAPPTDEERAAQAKTMADFMASRSNQAVAAFAREVTPKYLTPDQLRATYAAQGVQPPPALKT